MSTRFAYNVIFIWQEVYPAITSFEKFKHFANALSANYYILYIDEIRLIIMQNVSVVCAVKTEIRLAEIENSNSSLS